MSAQQKNQRGIVLAIVLVMIFALVTAVYTFQRRAIIDTTIASNRLDAAEADAIARGGLRVAEVLVTVVRAKHLEAAGGGGGGGNPISGDGAVPSALGGGDPRQIDALWQGIGGLPVELDSDRSLQIEIEDEGAKLNLNALVPPPGAPADGTEGDTEPDATAEDGEGSEASEEAVEYLTAVLEYVIDGMEREAGGPSYDPTAIAENILDFMDGDTTAVGGRSENEYYRRQDPPYQAWNNPLLSVDQLGLVEDVDPELLAELRHYVTVHPIGGTTGINLNRAEPWVLKLVYNGTSGNMRLIDDGLARDIYKLRNEGKLICSEGGVDPTCVSLSEVGNGELANGALYPPAALPATPVVFRIVASATVGDIIRRVEAIYDTRPKSGPQLLSWRRLRGPE